MCGIAGILDPRGAGPSPQLIARMTQAIAHRGPDDDGHHCHGPVALGNRRLAVIDPTAAGHQPMTSASGGLVLTYNGEIYNFRELRAELEQRGHRFRSNSDTEVVLQAYERWGAKALERFNGMFALAIWDRRAQQLLIARDRYGIKPLYYTRLSGAFLFASEIKCFLEHPEFSAELSSPHLLEYLTFQNLLTDGTLFKGVKLLAPGTRLTVGPHGEPRVERYWDFQFTEPDDRRVADEDYRDELDRLFRQAVSRQLVSDVPIGAHLSGGTDSGSITALAASALPHLSTFTVGFDFTSVSGLEWHEDERVKAEAMSYRFQTEHYEAVLKAGDMQRCLPDLVWHLEDLRVGQCYPNYYIARLASKFVTVVLTGTGGDELFAGYPWRYYRAIGAAGLDHYVEQYYRFWNRLIPHQVMARLFQPHIWADVRDVRPLEAFRRALPVGGAPATPADYVNHSLHLEARSFLHGLLVVEDKLSMAHGLENRVPFLDNDLVDFAQRVPVRLKLRSLGSGVSLNENDPGIKTERYYQRTRDGKLLLREVMRRYVPEKISNQVKRGFSGPDESWFRGDSIEYVKTVLGNPEAAIYEVLRPDTVGELLDDHFHGRENRRLLIWSLLSLEHWFQIFLRGARP